LKVPELAAALPPVQAGLLAQAVETSRHAVFVTNYDGDLILAVNQAACELTGYCREELLQLTPSAYTASPAHEVSRVYEQPQLKRRDGSLVRIGYWGSWVRIRGVDYLLTVTDPIGEL
jgi:PAS domain S-box-containing protein